MHRPRQWQKSYNRLALPDIARHPARADLLDLTPHEQIVECALDRRERDTRAFPDNVRLGHLADAAREHPLVALRLARPGPERTFDARLEVTARRKHGAEHIAGEGHVAVATLVPAERALLQGVVVRIPRPADLFLDAHVPAHHEPRSVQKQQREQPAHAAVVVGEGVDAREVEHEARDQDERVGDRLAHGAVALVAQPPHRKRGCHRRDWAKAHELASVGLSPRSRCHYPSNAPQTSNPNGGAASSAAVR